MEQKGPTLLLMVLRLMAAAACGNCGKPSRVFQAAEEIIKKMVPKATLVDFLGCGSFHKRPLPQFFLFGSFSFFVQIRAPGGEIIRSTIVYGRCSRSCPTLGMPGIACS